MNLEKKPNQKETFNDAAKPVQEKRDYPEDAVWRQKVTYF